MLIQSHLLDVRDDVRMHHGQELNPASDRGPLPLFRHPLFPDHRSVRCAKPTLDDNALKGLDFIFKKSNRQRFFLRAPPFVGCSGGSMWRGTGGRASPGTTVAAGGWMS
jgi:hypothetical protein